MGIKSHGNNVNQIQPTVNNLIKDDANKPQKNDIESLSLVSRPTLLAKPIDKTRG